MSWSVALRLSMRASSTRSSAPVIDASRPIARAADIDGPYSTHSADVMRPDSEVDHAFYLLLVRSGNRHRQGQIDGGNVGRAMANRARVSADRARVRLPRMAVVIGRAGL